MNTFIRVTVRSSLMRTTSIVKYQFAAVQQTPLYPSNLWISPVPARQFRTTAVIRDIGSAANEEAKKDEKKYDRSFVDYAESVKPSHYKVHDLLKIENNLLRRELQEEKNEHKLTITKLAKTTITKLAKTEEKLNSAILVLSLEQIRRCMELFEWDNYPHSWDSDFNQRKFTASSKIYRLIGDDRNEEIRYEKMLHYVTNEMNDAMKDLRKELLAENISFSEFARGYARSYREISNLIHPCGVQTVAINPENHFLEKSAINSVIVLLRTMGINERLISTVAKLQK